ncbi:hypothetical protein [Streptomyces sp. 8N616]|uniref:hypothetical protein n=1 Tax=Streptomyces sp. 8N616 TaxID=3457414 RepID=UPI003FD57689
MHLVLGPLPPQRPLSDTALSHAIREGQVELFRYLYRRHYAAVQAYTTQCLPGPVHAHEATSHVFAQLLQRMLSGESFIERRHPGCLRLQLLDGVRTTAVTRLHLEGEALSPSFRAWAAAGFRWPWGEDGHLALAFKRLPPTTQCLLWHSVVDRDDPALTARITGLARDAIQDLCAQARGELRRARTDLYLERLGRQDCKEVVRQLAFQPESPPAKEAADHLRICPGCMRVYKDVSRLDAQLEKQLPLRLLGWWPGEEYLRAKADLPVPLGDPPFLTRLLESARTEAEAPAQRLGRRPVAPDGAPSPGRRSRVPRRGRRLSPTTVAVIGFLIGVTVGMITLPGCQQQHAARGYLPPGSSSPTAPDTPPPSTAPPPPVLLAKDRIQAGAFTVESGTTTGSLRGSRLLGRFSLLRYDRVDFSNGKETLAKARLAGPPGGGASIELRLDSPTRPRLARINPVPDGSLDDISVPIAPVGGVHRVYVTAHCPSNAEPCVELHAFGTGSPP